MKFRSTSPGFTVGSLILSAVFILLAVNGAFAASPSSGPASKAESIDELYERAKKEGGQLTLYIALSARSEEVIIPLFKKKFPAIQINHVDATSEKDCRERSRIS